MRIIHFILQSAVWSPTFPESSPECFSSLCMFDMTSPGHQFRKSFSLTKTRERLMVLFLGPHFFYFFLFFLFLFAGSGTCSGLWVRLKIVDELSVWRETWKWILVIVHSFVDRLSRSHSTCFGWLPLDWVIDAPGSPGSTDLVKGNMGWAALQSLETLDKPS
jgi:hypothetical protein